MNFDDKYLVILSIIIYRSDISNTQILMFLVLVRYDGEITYVKSRLPSRIFVLPVLTWIWNIIIFREYISLFISQEKNFDCVPFIDSKPSIVGSDINPRNFFKCCTSTISQCPSCKFLSINISKDESPKHCFWASATVRSWNKHHCILYYQIIVCIRPWFCVAIYTSSKISVFKIQLQNLL